MCRFDRFSKDRFKNRGIILLFHLFVFFSCSKEDPTENGKEGAYPSDLKGTIYYDWSTEGVLKVSLPDGMGGSFIPSDSKLNNFYISRDGKWKLTVANESAVGQYDVRFMISDINTGAIAEELVYNGPGLNAYCKGYLSPDNRLILVTSNEKEDGITILKRNGDFVARILDINGDRIDFNVSALWLPGNDFLMTHGNYIIRVTPPYSSAKLVKEMEYEDWGDLAVNQAGTQLALRIANHVARTAEEQNHSHHIRLTVFAAVHQWICLVQGPKEQEEIVGAEGASA